MLTKIVRKFATTQRTYGGLKDSDRIFTNVYKDSDPYIKGALRRVHSITYRGIGIVPKIYSLMGHNGSSTKSNFQGSEVGEGQVFHLVSSIHSCPKLQLRKGQAI